MEDLETLPKRRKLSDPGDAPYEYDLSELSVELAEGPSGKGAAPLVDEANVEDAITCQKPRNDDKITWNFKRVHPEFFKCNGNIIERTRTADRKESDSTNALQQENALTLSKMEPMENARAPKRRLKIVHAHNTQERSNGNSSDDPIVTEQYSPEGVFPSPLTEENVRNVIKKLIKDHTREAADNADILRDKISALEIENKRLKHRVVVLFRALKEVLSRRRNQEVIPTTVQTSSIQMKPCVLPNDLGSPQTLPGEVMLVSPTNNCGKTDVSKSRELPTDVSIYNSLAPVTDGVGSFHQRCKSPKTVVSGLHPGISHDATSPPIPKRTPNIHTTSLNGSALNFPMKSICEEKASSFAHPPTFSTTFCTNQVQHSPESMAPANQGYCTVTTSSTKAVMVSKAIQNTVPLLTQVVNEIVPNTVTEMQDQSHVTTEPKLSKVPNDFKESRLCSNAEKDQVPAKVSTQNGSTLVCSLLDQNIKSHTCNESSPKRHREKLVDQQFEDLKSSEAESKQGYERKNVLDTKTNGLKKISSPSNGSPKIKFFPQSLPRVSHECWKGGLHTESPRTASITSQQVPLSNSECSFVLDIPIPGYGERKSTPLKDAGLGNANSSPKLGLVKSTSVFTPTPQRIIPNGSIEVNRPDTSPYFVNDDKVNKDKKAMHQTPYMLEKLSLNLQLPSKSVAAVSKHYCYSLNHGQEFFNGTVRSDGTKTVSSPLSEKPKSSAHEEERSNTSIILPNFKKRISTYSPSDQHTFPHLERSAISQVTESFSNKNLAEFTSGSTRKVREAPSSAKPGNFHNLPSSAKFYNGRECNQHTRPSEGSTASGYHVPVKPKFSPYATKSTKPEKQVPLMGSNGRFAPPVTELQAPDPRVVAHIPQFLNAEAKFARNQYFMLPMRHQIETAKRSSRESDTELARISCLPENSSGRDTFTANCLCCPKTHPSYDKERLLLQLLESNRASFIPQRKPRTFNNFPATDKQNLLSTRSGNQVTQSSHNSEIVNRYVNLQPQNHAKNRLKKPARPLLFDISNGKTDSVLLPGNPPSDVEGCKARSWGTTCSFTPQLELSSSCQRYLDQLKNSTGLPTLCQQNTFHLDSTPTPHLEREAINMNESLRAFPFSPPGSLITQKNSQQNETCSEQQVNLKSPNAENS